MIPVLDHSVQASFGLWLDNLLLRKGQAFGNYSYPFTLATDDTFDGYNVYKSPHAQWVYDSSISNAVLPSGVTADGNFLPIGSGVIMGYNDGRVLIDSSINVTNVSGEYSYKEVNVYFSDETAQTLLFDTQFTINPKANVTIPSLESQNVIPAIFIKCDAGNNEPFALGGEDTTVFKIRTVILADTSYMFKAICSILRDTVRTSVPLFGVTDLPFSYYGGLKDGMSDFNYASVVSALTQNSSNLMFIRKVAVSPFTDEVNNEISKNIVAGFIDFELAMLRYPRI